jgi:ribosome-binding factor A
MPRRRILRLNELLRSELSELLRRFVRDPRLSTMVTITEVRMSNDIKRARVYVSVLGTPDEKKQAMQGLRAAHNYLRHELGNRIRELNIPQLDFELDESIERGARILSTLSDLSVSEPGTP